MKFPMSRFACLVLLASAALRAAQVAPLEIPQLTDERLQISLYADAPQIVTPIGAAVNARGRLFVLESHTHLAPTNYPGPKRDRVKRFEGVGADGRAAKVTVFADDVLEGMNLAFSPDGVLHVATAKALLALPDRNDDGRADETRVLLRLETDHLYPHNQILGVAIAADGWIYVSRGNTAGEPHAWVGADGVRLEGYGNGGDIVRVRPDGSGLEPVATGFWNPFDLKFDRHGRLLCIDNDPDARGPNRLLHIVRGGDYGFKALYGGSGLHPYNAWDGELPGTLPMLAGIGESPSGVLDLSFGALPPEYRGTIAATIWAEHTVSLQRPKPVGVSLRAISEPFITGDRWFRPVAIVAAPDGTIYITDWVLKDYPNHGQGRIWRLRAREAVARSTPPAWSAVAEPEPSLRRLDRLMMAGEEQIAAIRDALRDEDPFVRHAAVMGLARKEMQSVALREWQDPDARIRIGALLALRRAGLADRAALLRVSLADPDEQVRLMALIWTGESELRELIPQVDAAAAVGTLTPRLFETWLATLQILRSPPPEPGAKRTRGFSIKRDVDLALLERIIGEDSRPASVRAYSLRRWTGGEGGRANALLRRLARSGDARLRIEALRTLAASGDEIRELCAAIVQNPSEPSEVRAEAIVALGAGAAKELTPLLGDRDPVVRTQAARTLRRQDRDADVPHPPAPNAADEWVKLLAVGGDPTAGERVFFASTATCAQCHRIDGRGGVVGPDLSLIARAVRREQIIRSIVSPSEEISPQFQGWEVKTTAGEVLTGLQGHWRTGGGATLILLDGKEAKIPGNRIAIFRAMEKSLMPEGLAALFTVEELRDLVAFLSERR